MTSIFSDRFSVILLVILIFTSYSAIVSSKVCLIGDPILREKCKEVPIDSIRCKDKDLMIAVSKAHNVLADFRKKNGFGRGISAPQVGYNAKFIALKVNKDCVLLRNGGGITLYNPIIIKRSKDVFTMFDDCLSHPDIMVCVKRHKSVSIRFINDEGNVETWHNCNQAMSELLQHEIDHLDGILTVDRAVYPPYKHDKKRDFDSLEGIVKRKKYLKNTRHYHQMVDYYI